MHVFLTPLNGYNDCVHEANPLRSGDTKPPVSGPRSGLQIAGLPANARPSRARVVIRCPFGPRVDLIEEVLVGLEPACHQGGQMEYAPRCNAARISRYLLCTVLAALTAACDSGSSGSAGSSVSTPPTASDTAPSVSPPTISGTPDTTVVAGTKYSFQPSASDTSGDALTFSIQNMPAWASFDPSSGLLTGTPSASNVGSYQSIVISVSDGAGSSQLAS